ncbi:hypothetical protein E9228_002791 [Curtobacterium flaccumfaciens]|uniref:Helix-turn-helix domain-containing protein n=1 Tax=Curtobacterium salicis TaxID=1779862 RepID=A0ABX0TD62_9MICO|nr:helix-turn-helix domain-containing protein [Curtobacterium sp. WW7]NII42133.1 hypothetical protein [Curtobacterium sp. WW7]
MAHKATSWAWELKLPGTRKLVLLALADMADEYNSCYPGQERLAEMTSVAVSTVRRALSELEQDGLIVRARRVRADGTRTSDRYRLALGAQPVRLTTGQSDSPNRSITTRSTGQDDRAYESSSNESPEESPDKRIYPSAFENAWSHWPRKNDKARALQQWQTIRRQHPDLDLTAAIIAHGDAHVAAGTPSRYVPYLKTWLSGKGWNDPLAEARTDNARKTPAYANNLDVVRYFEQEEQREQDRSLEAAHSRFGN